MSCANRSCSSTVVSSAIMGLAMHSARASSYVARHSSHGVSTAESKSKKINQDVNPDTTHIDPKCVWGDEGPVND
jgi:hypothetical protein